MIIVHGIKSCDSCRKALKWLAAEGIAHRFHDLRADGLEPAALDGWIATLGREALLNRRGTTWRQLPEAEKAKVDAARNVGAAAALMRAHPTLIKRPVFTDAGGAALAVGFGVDQQAVLRGRS